MYTPFWYNQPSILYERPYLFEIFPVKEFDNIRKLNAIVRFTIYYSIFVYIYNRDTNMFAVPVITALVTYLLWKNNSSLQKDETLTQLKNDVPVIAESHNVGCQIPTKDNPFMNVPFYDVSADKELPKSCTSYDNKGVQRKIENEFDKGLYRNYTDIFRKENSQRQFFTVPGREGVPDQSAFAHWLYRTTDTCKEGNGLACLSGAGTTGVLPSTA
tara:strand:- start:1620 stop:2264 length:645 start_codon:yes stop_codon:yes gene_type:complete